MFLLLAVTLKTSLIIKFASYKADTRGYQQGVNTINMGGLYKTARKMQGKNSWHTSFFIFLVIFSDFFFMVTATGPHHKKTGTIPMSKFPYELIDLTHALDASTPTWDGSCGFNHCIGHDYDPSAEFQFRTHKITMNEGIGTHMDSPAHCFPSGATIDQLSLSELVAPCVVIDISAQAHERYSLSPQDIKNFEDQYGPIPANAFVMVKTGWERFWNEPTK